MRVSRDPMLAGQLRIHPKIGRGTEADALYGCGPERITTGARRRSILNCDNRRVASNAMADTLRGNDVLNCAGRLWNVRWRWGAQLRMPILQIRERGNLKCESMTGMREWPVPVLPRCRGARRTTACA